MWRVLCSFYLINFFSLLRLLEDNFSKERERDAGCEDVCCAGDGNISLCFAPQSVRAMLCQQSPALQADGTEVQLLHQRQPGGGGDQSGGLRAGDGLVSGTTRGQEALRHGD